MALRVRRPAVDDLRSLVTQGHRAELTYEPVGVTSAVSAPRGYHLDRWSSQLGDDVGVFEAASRAIREWQVQRGAGLVVCAEGPPAVDDVVALSAPLPLGWIDVVCRVVAVIDEPNRSGFVYGTLPVHAEQGEESFMVERDADGQVTFEIIAVSKPKHPLARLAPPITRFMQRRATERYLDAMTEAVAHR